MNTALKRRTKGDEIFNSISHGAGIAFAVVATVLLIVRASLHGVFHLFILGGTICHFFGFWYLIPN